MMMNKKQLMAKLLKRCRDSPIFFIENFCKIKHPKAGVIPFKLFKYQKESMKCFKEFRFNIYRKTRQCGISTLAGAYALWYGMFFPHKTILIVSKRDLDAKAFLDKNVKFVYNHLPKEFKQVFGDPPPVYNEHKVGFSHGSTISSLTSSKDTLRSNSASLNIIDEAAFMPHMSDMWSAGWPTMQHGGAALVISTTNGVGEWYQITWEDAEKKRNDFNPIVVNWWDMDWSIEYVDERTGKKCKICPTEGIRKCETKEEIEKWGPYYSPWLEEQYRQLQQRGEAHLFRQEILAEFIGTGNTVLSREQLVFLTADLQENGGEKYFVVGKVPYEHPTSGEQFEIDFDNKLKIWRKPVRPQPDVIEQGKIIRPGAPGHTYSVGVDISSGEDDDFSAIEIIDCNELEQVAEMNMKVPPYLLMCMMDYLARYFNNAFVVPERTGLGIPVCQQFYNQFGYANVYHMKTAKGQRTAKIGFPTSPAHKPTLVKAILDMIGVDDGVRIYSQELVDQLHIFIHKGANKTGHVEGPGNHSDLTMALAMGLVGIQEAVISDHSDLAPVHNVPSENMNIITRPDAMQEIAKLNDTGGIQALAPVILSPVVREQLTPEEEIRQYVISMGGLPIGTGMINPNFITQPKTKSMKFDGGGPIKR